MNFWKALNKYIRWGNRVAEIYHGEEDDILSCLARLVGSNGTVYGVDLLNPFAAFDNMRALPANVKLVKADIPPLPREVRTVDAIVAREFFWIYDRVPSSFSGTLSIVENPNSFKALGRAIKRGGYLILNLSDGERREENELFELSKVDGNPWPCYQGAVSRHLPEFTTVCNAHDVLVFCKDNYLNK